MMSFYILVVLYKKRINDIVSFPEFLKIKSKYDHVEIIIVDNSEGDILQENINYADNHSEDFLYIANGKNLGLSKAYNAGITRIRSVSDNYSVMLSDDDTMFSAEYLENVVNSVAEGKSHLYCGVINSRNIIFSPKKSVSLTDKKTISRYGEYSNIMAINSGIVFDKYIIDRVGLFDESLFVDMIDYWFCCKLKKLKINSFMVLEGSIVQDFSGDNTIVDDRVWNRFKIYSRDCKKLIKCFPELFFPVSFIVMKRRIKLIFYSLKSKR